MDLNGTPHIEPDSTPSAPPFPHMRWLTRDEYDDARDFVDTLAPGTEYAGVTFSRGGGDFTAWVCFEVPDKHRPDQHLVVAVPARKIPWSEARAAAFMFCVGVRPAWPARRVAVKRQ